MLVPQDFLFVQTYKITALNSLKLHNENFSKSFKKWLDNVVSIIYNK